MPRLRFLPLVLLAALAGGFGMYRWAVGTMSPDVFVGGVSGPCDQSRCETVHVFDALTGLPHGVITTVTRNDGRVIAPFGAVALEAPDADMEAHWRFSVLFGLAGAVVMFVLLAWLDGVASARRRPGASIS